MTHANARLTPHGRLLLVRRVVEEGRPVAHVVKELGCSRQTGHRWLRRWHAEGLAGLVDRPSGPRAPRNRLAEPLEREVLRVRAEQRCGPVAIAALLGLPAATVGRVLRRHHVPLLRDLDPITGARIRARASDRRYEYDQPGGLVHLDVHKLGRIGEGGGWRVHGRGVDDGRRQRGFDYVHVAIDDHSRLAYAEILPDERGETCAGFLARTATFFAAHEITVQRVMTDNAMNYRRSHAFAAALAAIGARHLRTRPYSPWTNGKAERLNRTLLIEWAYRRPYTSNAERAAALPNWLDHYNTRRPHTALGGQPPISRVNKIPTQDN